MMNYMASFREVIENDFQLRIIVKMKHVGTHPEITKCRRRLIFGHTTIAPLARLAGYGHADTVPSLLTKKG